MPGEDFSALLASPATAEVNALHGALPYNHNVLACLDGEFMRKGVAFLKPGGNPKQLGASGVRPDVTTRGALRSVCDGRDVFTRYFRCGR